MSNYRIPAPFHRHLPSRAKDGVVRHFIEARIADLASEFPDEPNPRDPNPDRNLYKKIKTSLVDPEHVGHTSGAFGYRHSGLTLIAESVSVRDDIAEIRFGLGDGLVNGGHSHALIRDVLESSEPDEYVMLEILTGVADDLVPEIAEGRNTSLQVKRTSLSDLAGVFDGLKAALQEPDEVIWHEGDSGSLKAEHLVALISAYDPEIYTSTRHPNDVYRKVTDKFDLMRDDPDRIRRLEPIAQDIVTLYHTIVAQGADLWEGASESAAHGKVSGLLFLEHKPRIIRLYDPSTEVPHPMKYAAALVFTAAFRSAVEIDASGQELGPYRAVKWKNVVQVVELWRQHAPVLMRTFYSQLNQAGRNLNACVRSEAVWAAVYNQLVVSMLAD